MTGQGIVTGAGGGKLNVFCQATQPSRDCLWIKDPDISKVVIADLVHGTEEFYNTNYTVPATTLSSSANEYYTTPLEYAGVFAVGNLIYITRSTAADNYIFDTETGVFTGYSYVVGSSEAGRVCVPYGNTVYVFGRAYYGASGIYAPASDLVNKFDLETQITTTAPNMAIASGCMATAQNGNVVYFFGGRTASSSRETPVSGIHAYDLETEVATIKNTADASCTYGGPAIGQVGTTVHLFGGFQYYSSQYHITDSHAVYDMATDVFTLRETMDDDAKWEDANNRIKLLGGAPCLSWGGNLYIVGGYGIYIKNGSQTAYMAMTGIYKYTTGTGLFGKLTGTNQTCTPNTATRSVNFAKKAANVQIGDKLYIFGQATGNNTDLGITCFTAAGDNYDLNTAVVHLSEAGAYQPTLMQSDKMTLKPRVKRVMKQTADGLVAVAAAVVENGVATDII